MPSWQRWWNHWKDIPTNGLTTSEGLSFSEFTGKLTPSKIWYLDVFWIVSNPTPSQNKHGGIFLRTGSFASSSQFPEKSPLASWNSPQTMTIQVTSVDRWSSPIFDVFLNIEQHHFGATVWKSMGRGCQEQVVAMTSGYINLAMCGFRPLNCEGSKLQTNAKTNPSSNRHAFQTNGKCGVTKKHPDKKHPSKNGTVFWLSYINHDPTVEHGKAIQLHFLWQDWVFLGINVSGCYISTSHKLRQQTSGTSWYGKFSVATIPSKFCQICCQAVATTCATFKKKT